MKKINLVLQPDQFTSFTSYYLEEYWRRYFDISIYDPVKTYEKKGTVFVVWWMEADRDPWCRTMQDKGYKVAIDNLWEPLTLRDDYHWIEHKFSMRWNESLWWRALGYESYRPNKQVRYRALMQMRQPKPSRDLILDFFQDTLSSLLWSYMAKNKRLPLDTDDPLQGQRYMHPSWYDETYCSVVVETFQDKILHASEKSYKPIAYYHPYMIVSVPGALDRLKEQGFATFDNIFDESYDQKVELESRLQIIQSNLRSMDVGTGYDQETLARIKHNHDLFFDVTLVETAMTQEIVLPLLEYAET
jgi:hypothetical protein